MEFSTKISSPEKTKTSCLIVAIFENTAFSESAEVINAASQKYLHKIIKKGDIKGRVGQTLLLHEVPGINAARVLLVGCGKKTALTASVYKKIIQSLSPEIKRLGSREAICCLAEIPLKDKDLTWKISQAIQIIQAGEDRSDSLMSEKNEEKTTLGKITWLAKNKSESKAIDRGNERGMAVAQGVSLAKNLGDLPGNICTPTYLAEQAKTLGHQYKKLKTTILEEKKMAELGMGALLSVSKGSREPAKLIVMEYKGGAKNQKPVVLVGKGLTFDAGGISLKPGAGMDEMKYDMCGGASVFGTLKAITELDLPINVIGVVPASENLPDGQANKPGDIVTSLSGQTIEILNTDAEGRLILCDALTYCERFDPEVVIDIATLTGACIVALGKEASGLFCNHAPLGQALLASGEQTGDRCWELPIWEEYQEQLKSNFADMANIGGKGAGSITAACFLARYTKKFKWAHIDIAGTAWLTGANKGATGRPVPLLVDYLIKRAK
ncbi:MAG TPA: leucyl aminopeptidase [Gammaproteobacteria bacterium]|nr:leucyl aminopeptidase [Gammaproteobacteria bacterium]